jgi:hypothetical protein
VLDTFNAYAGNTYLVFSDDMDLILKGELVLLSAFNLNSCHVTSSLSPDTFTGNVEVAEHRMAYVRIETLNADAFVIERLDAPIICR